MRSNLLLLAVLAGCATQATKKSTVEDQASTSSVSTTPAVQIAPSVIAPVATPSVPVSTLPTITRKAYKVPELAIPSGAGPAFREALALFNENAQSDEFYMYVRKSVKSLQGGNETDVDRAITKTRECFDKLGKVDVRWQLYGLWPLYKSDAIGGWDGFQINQNPKKALTSVERAGHWYHELTHACKFTHEVDGKVENNIVWHPIIRQSWPYQAGYKFEDYVTEKRKNIAVSR
jgi:hypothetical protein